MALGTARRAGQPAKRRLLFGLALIPPKVGRPAARPLDKAPGMVDLTPWIGREERACETLDAPLARRWLATFDLPLRNDGAMPQGIHWCLGVPETPSAALGADGHPKRDGSPDSFLPPAPAPRRMWAGSACEFFAPLEIGAVAERVSRIEAIEAKQGSTGALTFVTILHETTADGALALRERQTLVYRQAPPPGSPPAPPPLGDGRFDASGWDAVRRLVPDAPLLFRYSALTFNTHRIHYDADYVRDVEGYRGLVVHGPLMASLLLQLADREIGGNALKKFTFRGMSPAVPDEELILAMRRMGEDAQFGVFAADGRQVMQASASL